MQDVAAWKNRWDKNYINGYADKLGNAKAKDEPLHWYFSKYLFPNWRELKKDDSVLELGCGNGAVAIRIFGKVSRFVGTDISEVAIKMIKERFEGTPNVRFECTTDLLSLDEKFDMIYSVTVFQHLPKEFTIRYIYECNQILKKGGALFFNVLSGIQNNNVADINFEYKGICEPSIGFAEEEIGSICKGAGFNSVKVMKMDVDGTTRYWWYLVVCIKEKE